MASDAQARFARLGMNGGAYFDAHLQLISAATMTRRDVVLAISYVGRMRSLLQAVAVAREQGAMVVAITQPHTPLADDGRRGAAGRRSGRPRDARRHRSLSGATDVSRDPDGGRRPAPRAGRVQEAEARAPGAEGARLRERAASGACRRRDRRDEGACDAIRKRRGFDAPCCCAAAPSSTAPARRASPPTCASRASASPRSARTWRATAPTCIDVARAGSSRRASSTCTRTTTRSCSPRRSMLPKISQGVTTVVVGNCGISLAPLVHADAPPPLNLLGGTDKYVYPTMAAYVAAVDAARPAVNVAALVGHSTLAGRDDGRSLPPGDAGRAGADGRAAARRHGRRCDRAELRRVLRDRRRRRHRRAGAARRRRRRRGRRLHDAHPRRDGQGPRLARRGVRRPRGAAGVPVVDLASQVRRAAQLGPHACRRCAHIDAARARAADRRSTAIRTSPARRCCAAKWSTASSTS